MTAPTTGTALDTSELRAMLADGRCLCSSSKTNWNAVEALLVAADERDALRARLAAVERIVAVWQSELDSGAIRDPDARYCWDNAAREVRAALATDTTTEDS